MNATAGLTDVLKRAAQIVKQLAPVVRNKLRDDPAALAAWESASHVERAPKRKKPAAKPGATTTA
ncbi:MAG TPA: hypothetical protein VF546_20665 [Pyrinomonadaceae bacterium]